MRRAPSPPRTRRPSPLPLWGLLLALLAAPAFAEVDFSGETVEWVIPFSETGGSAKWANFFAPLLAEELPGNPTVVVRYRPGAGSTEGANWFQGNQEQGDGTLIFGDSGYQAELQMFAGLLVTNAITAVGLSYVRARRMPVVYLLIGVATLVPVGDTLAR